MKNSEDILEEREGDSVAGFDQSSLLGELERALELFIAGDISAADLKHSTAPFGIYQQRNDKFMVRIRITGGHLELRKLQIIAKAMKRFSVGFMHLTTRQNLQLHDVDAVNVVPIVEFLTRHGIPFRGGGGNTFRNILVSTESGVSSDTLFDVFPYAVALNDFLLSYDKAFDLPRKLKIGFSSSAADTIHANLQDLGFIAKLRNSQRGFEVYAGGGMGKNSRYGIKLFDFLPDSEVAKCAEAITDLFYDHGDRSNRSKARLRYVLNRIGEEAFRELFSEYFKKSDAVITIREANLRDAQNRELRTSQSVLREENSDPAYLKWLDYAVSEAGSDDSFKRLTLFVPQGNLNAEELDKLHHMMRENGMEHLRISQSQDFVTDPVSAAQIPGVYSFLKKEFSDTDFTLESFKGHVLSCIGSGVCKIGIVNAPSFSESVASALDSYFADKPAEKGAFIKNILHEIRISGCPNSCSGHFAAKIGLYGMKKRVDGELIEGAIMENDGSDGCFIPISELPEQILSLIFQD